MRLAWLLALASCAPTPAAPPREDSPLAKLRAKTNAYTSFHYKAEILHGTVTVPIELAFRAPDRGLLRYGPNFTIVVAEGVAHSFERSNYSSVDYAAVLDALRKTYGEILPSAPLLAFTFGGWEMPLHGRGLLAALGYRPLGSRLGWLDEIAAYPVNEGNLYRKGAIEIELRDDGFIERAKVASSASFALKELTIDQPIDDAVFALPSRDGTTDVSEGRRKLRAQEIDESFHRWALEDRPTDAGMEALVKVDLARLSEPDKLVEFQRKNLEEALEAYRKQQPEAKPLALHEKIEMARGKALGSVAIIEDDMQKEFRRRLDRYLGGKGAQAIAARWAAAVSRQVEIQIRRPLDQVFVEKLKP